MLGKLIGKFKHLHGLIFGPMPLADFPDYDAYWDRRPTAPKVLHRYLSIARRIGDGDSVLDIGCGDGAFLEHMRSVKPGVDLFGLDLSATAIRRLGERGIPGAVATPGVRLRSVVDGDFDHVVMMEVIEHVHDAEQLVRDALEFRPKSLFITIPNAGYIMHRLRLMFGGRFPVTFIMYHMKEHIRFWTVKDFRQWADHLGLELLHAEGQERTDNPLRLMLIRFLPSLFAGQMIYHLRLREK